MKESPEAEKVRIRILKDMDCGAKWEQMVQLRRTAWMLKKEGLRMQHPDWSNEQLEKKVKEIFLYATT